MPNRPLRTYDEIVRATVPDPDTSWRPSDQQEREAYQGYHHLDARERELYESVQDALTHACYDVRRVSIEIDRDRVTLRGAVRTREALDCVVDTASRVKGVRELVDRLVLADD